MSASVLLVDDDHVQVWALAEILREEGLQVEGATTAREALALVTPFHPDVLIIDVKLPDMEAAALIRCVREIRPDVEAVVLTGYTRDWPAVAAALATRATYLAKPVTIAELLDMVADLTGSSRPRRRGHTG